MTKFIKAKLWKSVDKTYSDKFRVAENITDYQNFVFSCN